jgi:hypothetical protein
MNFPLLPAESRLTSLLSSLLPEDSLQSEEDLDAARLVCRVAMNVAPTLKSLDFEEGFDAAVGDFGCELRGYGLLRLVKDERLHQEAEEVAKAAKQMLEDINTRKSQKVQKICFSGFFEAKLKKAISVEMSYLIRARFLTLVKARDSGEYGERTSTDGLNRISKTLPKNTAGIIDYAQSVFSSMSLDFLEDEVQKLPEKESLLPYIEKGARRKSEGGNYQPKTFGCLFGKMKCVLACIKQAQAPIAIKIGIGKAEYSLLFYRSSEPGGKLLKIEAAQIPKEEAVVVFEGSGSAPDQEIETLLLAEAALCKQFGPLATTENNKDIDLVSKEETEIKEVREKFSKAAFAFNLYHIYAQNMKTLTGGTHAT